MKKQLEILPEWHKPTFWQSLLLPFCKTRKYLDEIEHLCIEYKLLFGIAHVLDWYEYFPRPQQWNCRCSIEPIKKEEDGKYTV